jgi:hypothetical protein
VRWFSIASAGSSAGALGVSLPPVPLASLLRLALLLAGSKLRRCTPGDLAAVTGALKLQAHVGG